MKSYVALKGLYGLNETDLTNYQNQIGQKVALLE